MVTLDATAWWAEMPRRMSPNLTCYHRERPVSCYLVKRGLTRRLGSWRLTDRMVDGIALSCFFLCGLLNSPTSWKE